MDNGKKIFLLISWTVNPAKLSQNSISLNIKARTTTKEYVTFYIFIALNIVVELTID